MSTGSGFGGGLRTSKRRAITSFFSVVLLFSFVLGQGGTLVAHAAGSGPSLTMGKVSSGSTSTVSTATTTTAASSLNVDLDQWANQPGQGWQNGDLNGNNSAYAEGLVVPFRLAIEGLTAGQHSIHLNYDFTAGGHEAYDFLATYNATENPALCASGGGAVSSMCPGLPAANTKTFPSDSFTPGSPTKAGLNVAGAQSFSGVGRLLTMYGGTIDSITGPTHAGPVSGNNSGDFVVTFTTSGSAALFAWGGHLAQSAYWKTTANNPNGAATISGAPWHMRTQQLDGAGNKNQDRSIQPSAIVSVAPNVSITKTADQATISAGDTAGFTITATNNGPGVAHNVSITDTLPGGVTWAETPNLAACSIASGVLSCDFGDLAEGASASVHVSGVTDAADCGTLTNTATVAASNEAPDAGGDNSATATVTVNCADIAIAKTADQGTVSAGQTIGFVITATNNGAGTASGVTVTDPLPADAGLAWTIDTANSSAGCSISGGILTCTFGSIGAGASKHVHITSPTTAATCGSVDNTAHVSTSNDGSGQSSDSVTVSCPDLNIKKVADNGTVSAGDPIGYAITVTNNGAGKAFGVKMTDTLPTNAGLSWTVESTTGGWSCSISSGVLTCGGPNFNLNAGASASVHITSPTTAASCGQVLNQASVSADNNLTVSTGQVTIVVQCASLIVTKVADDGKVDAGDPIGYTITVTNNGAGTARDVTLSDTLPTDAGLSWSIDGGTGAAQCSISAGELSCSFGDMASGASKTVHISSPTTSATCGVVSNSVSANTSNDGNPSAGPVTITVDCPDVSVVKTADDDTINAGDTAAFTIVVSSHGDGTARNVTLSDTLPGGINWSEDSADCAIASGVLTCDFGDLAPGQTRTVHVTGKTDAADCGELKNTATVSAANEADPDPSDNTSSATITVNCPDVAVVKTADQGTISAGDTAAFTIVVSNNGAGTAYGVTLNDPLPAGVDWHEDSSDCSIAAGVLSCDFGDLGSGDTRTVHVTGLTDAADCGELVNTATVSATNEAAADAADDSSTATITVDCPGIDVEKVADAGTVDAADQIGFTITVTNHGPGVAKDVVLSDTLPTNDGLHWSIDGGTGAQSCQIASGVLTCSFGNMASGASLTVHITSDTDATTCGQVNNTATVTIANGTGDESSASVTVNCPDLGIDIQKGGPDLAHVGDTIHYTFDVQLTTPETLFNVIVHDANCNEGAPTYISGDDGDAALETGEVWHYTCTHLVTATDPDPLPNTATVQGTADDGRTTTDQDDHIVDLIHPDIRIRKTVNPISGAPGDTVTYSYEVKNTGDTTLYNVSVDDDVIGHIGDIAQLDPGDSVTLTKDWVLPANVTAVTNVGTATGTDVLGTSVSDDDNASITIVEAIRNPTPPRPTAFTGSDALRLGTIAGLLLALGLLALAIGRRRRDAEA